MTTPTEEAPAPPQQTTADEHPVFPSRKVLARLKISPEVAWYLLERGYALPAHGPLLKTPEGSSEPGAVFDAGAVDRVIRSFRVLRHTKGKWAGQPLEPDPWQIAYVLAPVFGWVKWSEAAGKYTRVVRTLYVDIPRKNGKSTLAGGLAVYLTGADGEPGAEVVAAASTRDQAGFVFKPIKNLVDKAPGLRGRFRALTGVILHPKSGSEFKVISSAADAQHGANLHGAIIDELHIHKTPDLVETLETGTGSRDQPLVAMITTADAGKPNTIYARRRKYAEQIAAGVFRDPSFFGVVFALGRDEDPLKPSNWARANPGYPISPTHAYLKDAAKKARNSPAELAAFKRLHCGQRTRQTTTFIDLKDWDRNAGRPIREETLRRRLAFGGLDLGSVSDLTALCWLMPYTDGTPGFDAIWRFWTPEDNIDALNKRTADAAAQWVKEGWLKTTPGNVTDYAFIREQILEDYEHLEVESVGFDRWNATHIATQLLDDGIPLVEVGQGYKTMSPALKEAQRLVLMGKRGEPRLHHGGNPVMKWMVDNLAVATDPAGNVKPDKGNSADKIDGVSALVNAISEAMNSAELAPADYGNEEPLTFA